MSCVQAGKQFKCLGAPHLSHNNSRRSHPERCPDQIPDRDFFTVLRSCRPGLQPHQIGHMLYLKFCGVFNNHNPFLFRNKFRKCIQKSRLSATCSACDQNRIARSHRIRQKINLLLRDTVHLQQPFHGHRLFWKSSYRDDRSVDRHRRQHHMDTVSVFQPGIYDGLGFIDRPVACPGDLPDHVQYPFS